MSESVGGTTLLRRSRRNGRSTSVESTGNAEATVSRQKEKKSGINHRKGLAPLAEETQDKRRSHTFPKSPGRASNISGTTARTSGSVHELAEMNSEDMRNYLPELYNYSTDIIGLCTPKDASTAAFQSVVQNLRSHRRTRSNWEKYTKVFGEVLRYYATENYVNPSMALRGLFDLGGSGEIGDGPWRLDDVLYKANLAATVEELMSRNLGMSEHGFSLEKLERDFPERFLAEFGSPPVARSSGSSVLVTESFEVGLEVRTQFTVQTLIAHSRDPSFNADQIIEQCFRNTEDGSLRGWNIFGLQLEDLSKAQIKDIRSRIKKLETLCSADQNLINLDDLRAQYPAAEFVESFVSWARLRSNEIDNHLASLTHDFDERIGHGVQKVLDNEMIRRSALASGQDPSEMGYVELNYQLPSDAPSSSVSAPKKDTTRKSITPNKFGSPRAISRLLAKAAEANSGPSPHQALQQSESKPAADRGSLDGIAQNGFRAPPTASTLNKPSALRRTLQGGPSSSRSATSSSGAQTNPNGSTSLQDNVNEGDTDLGLTPMDDEETAAPRNGPTTIPPPEVRREVIALNRRIEEDQDKENDPTGGLERSREKRSLLDPQADAQRVTFESQPHSPASVLLNTEEPDEEGSDVSADEGFEEDTRVPPLKSSMRPPKRSRPSTEAAPPAKRVRVVSQPGTSARTSSHRPSQAREEGPPSSSQMYLKVNKQAKTLTSRNNNNGGVQTRTPWSEQETEALIDLIEELGTSWAQIQKEDMKSGGILISRGQVALKDKARNMKFDYLKAGAALPVNFDRIRLKQTQKVQLLQFGIEVPDL